MKYDFDKETNRKDTQSTKWGVIQDPGDPSKWIATDDYFGDDRIVPMWVADMDFPSPKPVVDALVKRAQHGIYGYSLRTDSYDRAVVDWMQERHDWTIEPKWIVSTPGVVPAVNFLVRSFVKPGEKVLIQRPVYYPFFSAIENNGCEIVSSSLILKNGRYEMDYKDFEKKAADPATKLYILCSPHNPVGRVWTLDELQRIGEICLKHHVLILSDEIHADLIFSGHRFIPMATINQAVADHTIVCTAPSKTFNLAGLHTSNIIIANQKARQRFLKTLNRCNMAGWANPFGVVACETAYRKGKSWLEQVMAYIEGNLDFLADYIKRYLPEIKVIRPDGTYLVWLDCRGLGMDQWQLRDLMLNKAKVFLDDGYIFGPEGIGFERINIACPRSILADALERIKHAVDDIND